jgi:hypothetical protein
MQDADARSRDYRVDGAPTGARRLRVPKMRVCDERLGVKCDEPPDRSAMIFPSEITSRTSRQPNRLGRPL